MNLTSTTLLLLAIPLQANLEPTRYKYSQPHMGTNCQILVYSMNQEEASRAVNAAFQRIKQLNLIMSDYDAESELRKLCARSGKEAVEVSADLFKVLSHAQKVSVISEGAFDITVGPVVKLWRRARKSIQMPDNNELEVAKKLVDYRLIELDSEKKTARLKSPGMLLDLGGIAKGYAAEEALLVLKKMGINSALVALGGDVAIGNAPPNQKGWKVGIAPVLEEGDAASRFLILANCAVSTSGDTEQYVELNGKRYSHLVDPKTGLGLTQRISVTIIAPNGIDSDSLTKVVSVLGQEKGMEIVDKLSGISCRVVRKKGDNLEVKTSPTFPTVYENKK